MDLTELPPVERVRFVVKGKVLIGCYPSMFSGQEDVPSGLGRAIPGFSL